MIIDSVKHYYNFFDNQEINPIENFSKFKILLLYIMTVMNENLLNIITGIATGFSINIFTNFVTIDTDIQTKDLIVWIIRFVSAIVFNYCIVKLTVMCSLLRSKARDEADKKDLKLPIENEIQFRVELLNAFECDYRIIKSCVIVGGVSVVILFVSTIIYPICVFVKQYSVQQPFPNSMDTSTSS